AKVYFGALAQALLLDQRDYLDVLRDHAVATIEVSSGSRIFAIPAGALHRLIYSDVVFGAGKIVMQTLRLPVERLAESGVELTDLRSIAFVFDRRATGTLYVGEVQVSN